MKARPSGRSPSATASRSRICAIRPSPAIAPTAIAAPAWSRSRASACSRRAASASRADGMKVKAHDRPRQDRAQDGVRAAGHRSARRATLRTIRQSKFWNWADQHGDRHRPLSRARESPRPTAAMSAMAVNLDACIQCNLCVRACREVQVNDVIGMAGRGHDEKIVFDFDDPMGALDLRRLRRMRAGLPDRRADAGDAGRTTTTCAPDIPTARSTACAPIAASAASSPITSRTTSCFTSPARTARRTRAAVREGPLRLRLRHNPQRLTKPMIRKDGVPKVPHEFIDPANPWTHFREATWDEALDRAAVRPEENPRPRRLARRWPASARPKARTKRPICSRSWCAPASAPTTSITARGCATPRRWRRCWKASAPARCRRPSTSARIPTSSS